MQKQQRRDELQVAGSRSKASATIGLKDVEVNLIHSTCTLSQWQRHQLKSIELLRIAVGIRVLLLLAQILISLPVANPGAGGLSDMGT